MDLSNQILYNQNQLLFNLKFYTMQDHINLLQQSNLLLMQKNIQLQKQLQKVKQWKLSTLRDQNSTDPTSNAPSKEAPVIKRKYNPRRQNLQKAFCCKLQNCPRKYSSRIALNSHLRRKHNVISD